MAVLLPDQLDEFVNLTLENFKRKKWVDISLDLQRYEFADRFMSGKKDPEKGGSQLTWKIQHTNTGTARHSELFDVDQTAVVDLTTEAKVPWTKQTVNFSYDVDEDAMQTDMETIVKEIAVREHSMYNDYFELMEEAMWTSPASATESPRTPNGIPYYIVKNDTEGFNGGAAYGTTKAEVNPTTYANWKNYTFEATDVSRDDFIAKALKAVEFCRFLTPREYPELGGRPVKSDWSFHTTYRLCQQLEKYLQGSNDNLGLDIAKYSGSVSLKGNAVRWVPYLESNDTTDPFYGINWKVFMYYFKKGRHMVRQKPQKRDNQHTVRVVHMDNWGQFGCYNPRLNFVGHFNNGVS